MNNIDTTLRIHGPVDLLTGVPHLLGFRPQESLVLVGLTHGALVVTARIDLADAEEEILAETVAAMVRGGARQFVAAIYTEDQAGGGAMPYSALAATVGEVIDQAGATLLDALIVAGDVWFSYLCNEPACCPPEGRHLPNAPTPFQAAATVAGMTVAPTRADLAARFEPADNREALRTPLERAEGAFGPVMVDGRLGLRASLTVQAIKQHMDAADTGHYTAMSSEQVTRIGAALRHVQIRDWVWLEVDQRRGGGDELWLDLIRRLPAPYDAGPLLLYGWSRWRRGDGAVAEIAASRALDADPAYSAAQLLRTTVAKGINPASVPALEDTVRR